MTWESRECHTEKHYGSHPNSSLKVKEERSKTETHGGLLHIVIHSGVGVIIVCHLDSDVTFGELCTHLD